MAVSFPNGLSAANQRIQDVASPSAATDATNKTYVDNLISGLSYKDEVRAATTAAGVLATDFENGDTLDGVTLATGDRILVKNQSTASENGIRVVQASGAPTRASDNDSTAEMNNATVYVTEGTVNAGREYTQTAVNPVINTDAINWTQKTSGLTYSADGNGIELSGTTFSIELDGTTLSKSSSGIRIGSGAAGAGLVESSGVLAVGAGTGITVNADDVAVNFSTVARKQSGDCGNASATPSVTVTGITQDAIVQVYESAFGTRVFPDIAVSSNTVTFGFGTTPAASNTYRYTAMW